MLGFILVPSIFFLHSQDVNEEGVLRDRVPPGNTWVRMNTTEEPFQSLKRDVDMTRFFHKGFTETKLENLSFSPLFKRKGGLLEDSWQSGCLCPDPRE